MKDSTILTMFCVFGRNQRESSCVVAMRREELKSSWALTTPPRPSFRSLSSLRHTAQLRLRHTSSADLALQCVASMWSLQSPDHAFGPDRQVENRWRHHPSPNGHARFFSKHAVVRQHVPLAGLCEQNSHTMPSFQDYIFRRPVASQ